MEKDSAIRNFSFVGIGKIVTIALQALFYLLFASILGPGNYGQLSVIIALAGTTSTISRLGLNVSLQVYQAKEKSELIQRIKTLFLLSTAIGAIVLLPISIIVSMLCIGLSFFAMTQAEHLGLRKYKQFMISNVLRGGLFFVLPFILYFIMEIPGIVLGFAIANLVSSIPLMKTIKIQSFIPLKSNFKALAQNYLLDSAGSLWFMSDKLIIASFFSLTIVGIYQFNLQVLFALTVLPAILSSYLITEESVGITHGKINRLTIIASIVLVIVSIIASPYFVNSLFSKYSEGIFPLQILLVTIIPLTLSSIFESKLLSMESKKIWLVPTVKTGILFILLVILSQFYELVGMSLAILISSSIGTILGYIFIKKLKN